MTRSDWADVDGTFMEDPMPAPPKAVCDPFVDNTKTGIFRDHSCWKCSDGEKPCVQGGSHRCEFPHARND